MKKIGHAKRGAFSHDDLSLSHTFKRICRRNSFSSTVIDPSSATISRPPWISLNQEKERTPHTSGWVSEVLLLPFPTPLTSPGYVLCPPASGFPFPFLRRVGLT